MRRKSGEIASHLCLPAIDGSSFDTNSLNGKSFMLSFFRFASCPFCNLRVHELVNRFDEFGDNFTIVAVFDSPLDNLIKHTAGHKAPFPILADESNRYYGEYGIERHRSQRWWKGHSHSQRSLAFIASTERHAGSIRYRDEFLDRFGRHAHWPQSSYRTLLRCALRF